MTNTTSSIDRASERLAGVVRELGRVSGDVEAAGQLLALLGWSLPPGAADIGLTRLDVSTVADRLEALTELRSREDTSDAELAAAVAELVTALVNAFKHVEDIAASLQATPEYLSATQIVDKFFPRLADLLVIQAVGYAAPIMVPLGVLLGVFELNFMPADPTIFQVEHVRQVVRWDRFSPLFSNPTSVLHDVYGWGTPQFAGSSLVTNIGRLMEHLADNVALRPLPRTVEEQIVGQAVPEADTDPATQLFISIAKGLGLQAYDVGVTLYTLHPTTAGGPDGGLGLSPYVLGTKATSLDMSDTLSLVVSASAAVEGGIAFILRAGRDPQLITGLIAAPDGGSPPASFALMLRDAAPAGERHVLFTAPGLTIDAAAVTGGLGVEAGPTLDPKLTGSIEDGRIQVVPDRSDSFLASILPADGITTTVDLDVSWSRRDGVSIRGGAGLHTTFGLHQRLGPIQVEVLDLALIAASEALSLAATVNVSAFLGPVTATVASVGAAAMLKFQRGNLGNTDLGVQFQPPSGVGLAIDAAGVTGGGFLFFDPAKGQYGGVVLLTLEGGLTLTAIGLIDTHLPNGQSGFSFVVMITAEGFEPIPLGLGFTLTGLGGLLALNRTCNQDALRAGIQNDSLKNLLFPADPIRNAPQLFGLLTTVFPPQNGSYLLGPAAQISWGTPALLTLDLALILELGTRTRLVILGRLAALLPTPQEALVRLQMNALGVLDFDQKTASLDAALYDSRLLGFPLTGSMALRLNWGNSPGFALAIGGFHPAFSPPPGFPSLQRLALSLSDTPHLRLRCDAYFALTSNTFQFGAHAELVARAGDFSVAGQIGYDVLVQFDPFGFVADFEASVQLKYGSTNLFMVKVAGELAGPRPLHVKGKATFSIFWCDFSVGFDETLVEGQAPPALDRVRVLDQLKAALNDTRNWGGTLAEGERRLVTLRSVQAGEQIALHPLGRLGVQQKVVPLGMPIARFGQTQPADGPLFQINSLTVNGNSIPFGQVDDFFAPGQFLELSDDDRLAAPSFERMAAGIQASAGGLAFTGTAGDVLADEGITFETVVIDPQHTPKLAEPVLTLSLALLNRQVRFGAAAQSAVRRSGTARYRVGGASKNRAVRKGWTVIASEDGSAQGVPGVGAGQVVSYAASFQGLQQVQAQQPQRARGLMLVRAKAAS